MKKGYEKYVGRRPRKSKFDSKNDSFHLIGIHGKARSGKDTVADYLVANYGFTKMSFAEPLYKGLKAMFGDLVDVENKDARIQELGASARRMLQTLGTEWGRDTINQDLWVKFLNNRIITGRMVEPERHRLIVVSDVRFHNEAEYIYNFGSLFLVENPIASIQENSHASERGIDFEYFENVLVNDGEFSYLYEQIDSIMSSRGFEVP